MGARAHRLIYGSMIMRKASRFHGAMWRAAEWSAVMLAVVWLLANARR